MSEDKFGAEARKFQVTAFFFTEAVKMEFKSREAGRPIFEEQERVRIVVPGNRGSVVVEPVNDEHRQRWAEQYGAFKAGREQPLEGTPLRDWPHSCMTAAKAEELAYFHIRTVEQLAAISDDKLQNLGMGARELRQTARTFLEAAKSGIAPLERLHARLDSIEAENGRLKDALAGANARIAELEAKKGKTHG
jgi:hypothetical protein